MYGCMDVWMYVVILTRRVSGEFFEERQLRIVEDRIRGVVVGDD